MLRGELDKVRGAPVEHLPWAQCQFIHQPGIAGQPHFPLRLFLWREMNQIRGRHPLQMFGSANHRDEIIAAPPAFQRVIMPGVDDLGNGIERGNRIPVREGIELDQRGLFLGQHLQGPRNMLIHVQHLVMALRPIDPLHGTGLCGELQHVGGAIAQQVKPAFHRRFPSWVATGPVIEHPGDARPAACRPILKCDLAVGHFIQQLNKRLWQIGRGLFPSQDCATGIKTDIRANRCH